MSLFSQIETQLDGQATQPPVHLWQPDLSGDIDIVIRANGDWYHEGSLIERHSLVILFSSILRREDDGHFYLVTPVEKWRLQVEDAPLLITAVEISEQGTPQQAVIVTSNVERHYPLGEQYPLVVEYPGDGLAPAPYVELDNGLRAKVSRAVFYELVAFAQPNGSILELRSNQQLFNLGSIE